MIITISLFGFLLGTALGSLALALADRALCNGSFFGRSACPHCHKTLAPADLVPIFSYFLLKGRCRYCHKNIKIEYLLSELIMGLAVGLIFFTSFFNPPILNSLFDGINFYSDLVLKVFIATVLMIIAITDLKKTLIPDRITYPAIVVVALSLLTLAIFHIWQLYLALNNSPIGKYLLFKSDYFYHHAFLIASPLWGGLITAFAIGLFFLLLIIATRGRGMGGGDLKLGILIGLYFAFPQALTSIMLAFFIGSIFAIALIILKRKHFGQTIPFGPFLSLGAFLTLLYGTQITNWFLNLKLY